MKGGSFDVDCCDHDHNAAGSNQPGHSHGSLGHSHLSHADTTQKLGFALILTFLILAAEVVGGVRSGSLALLSDAAHMVTDVAALGLAWYAQRQAGRPPTGRRTYGFHRAGIMAAMVNATSLLVIAVYITWEALERLRHPPEAIGARLMMAVAAAALLLNLLIAWFLSRGGQENLNVRSALLHVIGDAAASAGVIVGGIVIAATEWLAIDPVLSILIAMVVVYGAWQILVETNNVLMEGTPTGLDLCDLEKSMAAVSGVREVHHLHVWALCPGVNALSGHVVIDDQTVSETERILESIQLMLQERYHVDHATIQFEHQVCGSICTIHGSDFRPS